MVTLPGCVSLKTDMINADGTIRNCEASGGGLGLGAVIGVGSAMISRELCVDSYEESGFIELEDAGTIQVQVENHNNGVSIISTKNKDLLIGDVINKINGNLLKSSEEFRSLVFSV